MEDLQTQDLWKKEAYDSGGRYLGPIEAVALGRDRIPHRVGVQVNGRTPIRFFSLEGAQVDGKRVILSAPDASNRPLRVVVGGSG
jgi:hypothetical protein